MREEKIITIYTTAVKPGLAITPFMTPDPIIVSEEYLILTLHLRTAFVS